MGKSGHESSDLIALDAEEDEDDEIADLDSNTSRGGRPHETQRSEKAGFKPKFGGLKVSSADLPGPDRGPELEDSVQPGDKSKPSAFDFKDDHDFSVDSSYTDILQDQYSRVQELLTSSHDRSLRMMSLQVRATCKFKDQVKELKQENERLRERLARVEGAPQLPPGMGASWCAAGSKDTPGPEVLPSPPREDLVCTVTLPLSEPPAMLPLLPGAMEPKEAFEAKPDRAASHQTSTDADMALGIVCNSPNQAAVSKSASGNSDPNDSDKRLVSFNLASKTKSVGNMNSIVSNKRSTFAKASTLFGVFRNGGKMFGRNSEDEASSEIRPSNRASSSPEAAKRGRQTFADTLTEPKKVFADAAAMKEKVRQAIGKHEYNVADFYKDSGICMRIATHARFEQFTLMVISVNAIWIAVDADLNQAVNLLDADPVFQVAEHLFCTFFVFELAVRFMSFKVKRNVLKDAWFVFDSFLVIFMVFETWVMSIVLIFMTRTGGSSDSLGNASILRLFRLLRLTRMARMARLLKAIPELMIMIKGMAVATRSVFFTLTLLGIIIYLFAITFRQLTDGLELGERYFRSVPEAMTTLLLQGTLPDLAEIAYDISRQEIAFGFLFLFFVLLASLTVMNMLVGVLCEVVNVVSSVEKEQLVVNFVSGQLKNLLVNVVGDVDQPLSKEAFLDLLGSDQGARALHEVGVDVLGLMEITDFLFKDDRRLAFPEFMAMVLELRGTNTATVKHIVDLQKFVHLELRRTQAEMLQGIRDVAMRMDNQGHASKNRLGGASATPSTSISSSNEGPTCLALGANLFAGHSSKLKSPMPRKF